jgi:hypothetical protein
MLGIVKDRYRPIFCSDLFYLQNENIFAEWNQQFKKLSSTEKVQAWTVALSLLRRPQDWYGGRRKQPFTSKNHSHPILLRDLAKGLSPIQIPSPLQDLNLFEVMNQVYIKAIPESALRSLTFLTDQTYPLQIIQHVPTPKELLQFQLSQKRVISFNEDFSSWSTTLYHGRDFLSFIIHDLIHADHFFATDRHRAGQLGFYRCIEMILESYELTELLKFSSFEEAFEYIISDMNSHPVHLFKTLQARLQQAVENEMKVKSLWFNWTLIWSSEEMTVHSALQKINTQLFSDIDALTITRWCTALGHKSPLA